MCIFLEESQVAMVIAVVGPEAVVSGSGNVPPSGSNERLASRSRRRPQAVTLVYCTSPAMLVLMEQVTNAGTLRYSA